MVQIRAIPRKGNCHLTNSLIYHSDVSKLGPLCQNLMFVETSSDQNNASTHIAIDHRLWFVLSGSCGLMRGQIKISFWKQLHFGCTVKSDSSLGQLQIGQCESSSLSQVYFFKRRPVRILLSAQLQHLGSPKPGVRTHSYQIIFYEIVFCHHAGCHTVDGRNSAPIYIMENLPFS